MSAPATDGPEGPSDINAGMASACRGNVLFSGAVLFLLYMRFDDCYEYMIFLDVLVVSRIY